MSYVTDDSNLTFTVDPIMQLITELAAARGFRLVKAGPNVTGTMAQELERFTAELDTMTTTADVHAKVLELFSEEHRLEGLKQAWQEQYTAIRPYGAPACEETLPPVRLQARLRMVELKRKAAQQELGLRLANEALTAVEDKQQPKAGGSPHAAA